MYFCSIIIIFCIIYTYKLNSNLKTPKFVLFYLVFAFSFQIFVDNTHYVRVRERKQQYVDCVCSFLFWTKSVATMTRILLFCCFPYLYIYRSSCCLIYIISICFLFLCFDKVSFVRVFEESEGLRKHNSENCIFQFIFSFSLVCYFGSSRRTYY